MKLALTAIALISFISLALFGFAMVGHADGCAGVCLTAHVETIKSFGEAVFLVFSLLLLVSSFFVFLNIGSFLSNIRCWTQGDLTYQPHALAWLALHENSPNS